MLRPGGEGQGYAPSHSPPQRPNSRSGRAVAGSGLTPMVQSLGGSLVEEFPLDDIARKAGSRFAVVVAAADRAQQIKDGVAVI